MPAETGHLVFKVEPVAGLCSGTDDQYTGFDRQVTHRYHKIVVRPRGILQRINSRQIDGPVVEPVEW